MDVAEKSQLDRGAWVKDIEASKKHDTRSRPWQGALEREQNARVVGTFEELIRSAKTDDDPRPQPPTPTH